jgi:hypothetical protein
MRYCLNCIGANKKNEIILIATIEDQNIVVLETFLNSQPKKRKKNGWINGLFSYDQI